MLYFPIDKFFLEEKKFRENIPPPPGVFFKYVPKTGTGMRYAWLTDYVPIRLRVYRGVYGPKPFPETL